jgi:hypothetical protein
VWSLGEGTGFAGITGDLNLGAGTGFALKSFDPFPCITIISKSSAAEESEKKSIKCMYNQRKQIQKLKIKQLRVFENNTETEQILHLLLLSILFLKVKKFLVFHEYITGRDALPFTVVAVR